ncbi:MAG: type II secretion system protein [Clostridia bacterium]|nr:type II secretion system protein [Clostridia bacterium]
MLKSQNKKKGFTIVELVIVIAVIAVLSAVLIPTFVSLVKKANESSDIQAVRAMNVALTADGVVEPTSLVELFDVLEEAGIEAEDYKPLYKGRYFYWDKGLNNVLYVDSDKTTILFPKKAKSTGKWYTLDGSFDASSATIVVPTTAPAANSTTTLQVASAADFVKAAEYVNKFESTYANTNVKTVEIALSADIDLQGADVNFMSKSASKLDVVFKSDVAGTPRKISGLFISDKHATTGTDSNGVTRTGYGHSLFYVINNLTVSDITIEDSAIGGFDASQSGFFAAQVYGTAKFTNVTVKNSEVQGQKKVGVLCGYTHGKLEFDNVTIENCTVTTAQGEAGLIAGVMTTTRIASTENVVTGTVNIVNSKVEVADFATVKEIVDGGKTIKVVQFVEDGVTEWKVAYGTYGLCGTATNSSNVTHEGVTGLGRLYDVIDTATDFANLKGSKAA